jgi:hypothetical protein
MFSPRFPQLNYAYFLKFQPCPSIYARSKNASAQPKLRYWFEQTRIEVLACSARDLNRGVTSRSTLPSRRLIL